MQARFTMSDSNLHPCLACLILGEYSGCSCLHLHFIVIVLSIFVRDYTFVLCLLMSMGNSGSKNGGTVPYKAIYCGDIPLHSPYIGLIYGRYFHLRFLKWPLMMFLLHLVMFTQVVVSTALPGFCVRSSLRRLTFRTVFA